MIKNKQLHRLIAIAKKHRQFTSQTQVIAAAITATEMYFRPLPHRLIEYLYVALLLLSGRDATAVSVGISQISIRHYVSLEGKTQFEALRSSVSARANLAICCKIIETNKCESLEDVSKLYNGSSNQYYRLKLKQNYDALQKQLTIIVGD